MRRSYEFAAGLLVATSPWPLALAVALYGHSALLTHQWWVGALAIGSSLGFLLGGVLLPVRPRLGGYCIVIATASSASVAAHAGSDSPGTTLAILLSLVTVLGVVWRTVRSKRRVSPRVELATRARGSAVAVTVGWTVATLVGWRQLAGPMEIGAVSASVAIGVTSVAIWMVRRRREHARRFWILVGAAAVSTLVAIVYRSNAWDCLGALLIFLVTAVAVLPEEHERVGIEWWEPVLGHPERLLGTTFLFLCMGGTVLLALPVSSSHGTPISIVDAAFTSVSAVCVTGLIVLDTPHDFSALGQVVILVLIQLGGLGIMTFATVAIRLLGQRMSLRQEGAVAGLFSAEDRSRIFDTTRRIITITLAFEGVGAVLLFIAFLTHDDGVGAALWRAVFTSVSAFCNAGFALQTDNLIPYQSDPWILHVVAILIIAGGLSPAVIAGLPRLVRRSKLAPVQHRLVAGMTLLLLLTAFFFILTSEWSASMSGLSLADRIHNAWFQSVTLRTAGFNSVDTASMRPSTLMVSQAWMFVGGAPGGTAGGIKVTTAAVLILAVITAVRGHEHVTIMGRRIPHKTVYRAAAIATVAVAGTGLAVIAILLTQNIPVQAAVFEVFSALGTVGLSIGGTARLDAVGKVIIIACMFLGRIGTLTLFMVLSQRAFQPSWKLPEGDVDVG